MPTPDQIADQNLRRQVRAVVAAEDEALAALLDQRSEYRGGILHYRWTCPCGWGFEGVETPPGLWPELLGPAMAATRDHATTCGALRTLAGLAGVPVTP